MSETVNDDNFAAAFERLAALGDKPVPDEPVTPTPAPVEEPKAEEPPIEEPKAEETPPEELAPEEPPAEEPKVEEPPKAEEPPKPSAADEMLNRLADLVKDRPPPAATPTPEPEPELYSAEEKALLSKYEEEWPDVARAETLRRKGEYRELVGYMFREVAGQLAPLLERVDALAQRTHLSDLQTRVSGYEDIRDKVVDWVEAQPAYLKAAYTQVVNQGTVDEVADLIDRWRKDTGVAVTPPTRAPAAPARKAEAELPPAAKQAAAALAPVSSKRSAVVAGVDPEDFDSAFRMAAEA